MQSKGAGQESTPSLRFLSLGFNFLGTRFCLPNLGFPSASFFVSTISGHIDRRRWLGHHVQTLPDHLVPSLF